MHRTDVQSAALRLHSLAVTRLIVFADDWGRHPSSCQHLVGALLDRYPATWVNTIGMRRPRVARADLAKVAQRLGLWSAVRHASNGRGAVPPNLTVVTPLMWPGFHYRWERGLNGVLVQRALGRGRAGERRVVLTTLPIAHALLDRLRADATVYYCVDDFSAWPGLDGGAMRELEQRLVERADCIVAASRVLHERFAAAGRRAALLTHGVDVALWSNGEAANHGAPPWAPSLRRPIAMFWGLIDERLDLAWVRALQDPRGGMGGSLVLAGPVQAAGRALSAIDGVVLPGPVPYGSLPQLAALADVLVMPYIDSPVTRAMQPLKWNEYLATRRPVIARDLPATRIDADAADIADSAESFARIAAQRARGGTPAAQLLARRRVLEQSWQRKAGELEALLAEYL
jgi:hypothetical protein